MCFTLFRIEIVGEGVRRDAMGDGGDETVVKAELNNWWEILCQANTT